MVHTDMTRDFTATCSTMCVPHMCQHAVFHHPSRPAVWEWSWSSDSLGINKGVHKRTRNAAENMIY
jgi:hypothetical protein